MRDAGVIFNKDKDRYEIFEGGISLAKKRAESALKYRKNGAKIRRAEAKEKVDGYGIEFKAEVNPTFNDFELKILEGARK